MIIRSIVLTDLDMICQHRESMFLEAGRSPDVLTTMAAPFRQWLMEHLAKGTYFGFFAEENGHSIGGVGMMEIDWPPHPAHPLASKRGYVLNVFVDPAYRGRGIARALMKAAEIEFLSRGIDYIILHATNAGRALYESDGWIRTTEMAKNLQAS
ncbi:GNAT family N-acetyltransferase (plasmid) [Phyllobacterium sp. 628]|uniref:GNAT family N-acetyltransferase n=1 Tax=Phyllobacterium sp. 628 TaxID=2718938 RepID=UPI00166260B0|nr:GNAT family N-acetyltransferase [Phyllobacterium sp. 628]QND54564.1 GNAT family N-acetyltransferase [Phyllobacterium sp. 628]